MREYSNRMAKRPLKRPIKSRKKIKDGTRCPYCGAYGRVYWTGEHKSLRVRRRHCVECNRRWVTDEVVRE